MMAFEESPKDFLLEEEHSSGFEAPDKFELAHQAELKKLRGELNRGMSTFAGLLSKFDADNPAFNDEEAQIMDDILIKKKTPIEALKASHHVSGFKAKAHEFKNLLRRNPVL